MTNGLSEAPGIGRLLSEHSFTVPNHQRDYSWTEDELTELLDDVTSALASNNPAYFIGCAPGDRQGVDGASPLR